MAATNHDYDLSCAPLIMVHDFNHDYFGLCAHVSRPEALELPVRCVRIHRRLGVDALHDYDYALH